MENTTSQTERAISEIRSQFEKNSVPPVLHDAGTDSNPRAAARRIVRDLVTRGRRNWVREMVDWARCKSIELPTVQELERAIADLDLVSGYQEEGDDECPIFLLATGWRSGSTLLQRIVSTDPNVLLWGEPLGEMALLPGITAMLAQLSEFPDLQQLCSSDNPAFASLATSWIATLYPPGGDLRKGLRALLTTWMGNAARQRGFIRWGFKEVRLGAADATVLHWLYPKAKFILLTRNPYDCYLSLSDSGWRNLYHRRPDIRIDSAAGLARHWNRLALSWSELPPEFPAYRIKYEDMVAGKVDFQALGSWLGIRIREEVAISHQIGHTARRRQLGWCQRLIVAHETREGMHSLGYSDSGTGVSPK